MVDLTARDTGIQELEYRNTNTGIATEEYILPGPESGGVGGETP